jgi:hypothetical protein
MTAGIKVGHAKDADPADQTEDRAAENKQPTQGIETKR